MMPRTIPVMLTAFLLLTALGAEVEEDPRKEYTVAVTGFTALGLPREHDYLSETLPRLVLAAVGELETHSFDAAEKRAYRERLAAEERRRAASRLAEKTRGASLARLRRENGGSPESDVAEAREALLLAGEEPEFEIADEKPVRIYNEGRAIPSLPADPARFCREENVDLILSGRIETIGELVYFSLSSYSWAEGRWNRFYSSAGAFTTLEEALNEARGGLRRAVLGREWSSLSVETGRPAARIYLDGRFVAVGNLRDRVLAPGSYQLTVEADGAEPVERRIELVPAAEERITLELVDRPLPAVGIATLPAGADVYLSSRWIGETPLFLPDAGREGTLRLTLDGYRDILFPADDLGEGRHSFTLERELYDRSARFQAARDRLYTAVGLFTLSLPVTFFSYSLYRDYYNQASLYGDEGYADSSFLYNGLFYGSLYGSSLLFVHLVRSLGEYRRSGADTF